MSKKTQEKEKKKTELRNAYKIFSRYKEWDKMYACMEHLYRTYDDTEYLEAFRKKMNREFRKSQNGHTLELARRSYILSAPYSFDDYMVAMEWNRPYDQKFYLPRREKLLPIVNAMQMLADDKLDLLCISAPPGIGKTGLGDFYMTFCAGRHPDLSILMGSHSNGILNDNYNECVRMCSSDEYNWTEIFPGHSVVRTNAADMKIDIDKAKKFSNFQFVSVGASMAGKVRAQQLLYCDDLIPNLETALNKERLDKVFAQYGTDLRQREQGETKELHIATRWSVNDVIGRLERMNEGNPRAMFITIPALDENGESNFDYGGSLGWTTEKYRELQKTMDDASWRALYMNEPIEREGLLFDPVELRYYFDLPPEDEPDAILAVCDTKDRGVDDCVMPIAYKYGEDYYIEDFVCDNSAPDVTVPRLIEKLNNHKVKMARFESNSAGGMIARQVQEGIEKSNGITSITTKYSLANKETRIIVDSAWVKKHCLFLDRTRWSNEYRKAMNGLTGYSLTGRNKKDDVADAMSMLANFAQNLGTDTIRIRKRMF